MKQSKKPTRDQKALISKNGLDPTKCRVISDSKTALQVTDAEGNVSVIDKK